MSDILISKLRPANLDDVIGQAVIKKRLKRQAEAKNITHALFEGEPGVGKTTCALALCHELYGDDLRNTVLQLNASDERGIETIRTKVQDFAKVISTHPDVPFKIVFLDEADYLTKDAQATLRRVMEDFSEANRFILSCNYVHRIIPPIQDRCSIYRFKPLDRGEIFAGLNRLIPQLGIKIEKDAVNQIAKGAHGSMRKALNILEDLSIGQKEEITIDQVYDITGNFIRSDIGKFIKACKEQNWQDANRYYYGFKFQNVHMLELIHEMVKYIDESQSIPNNIKCRLYYLLGELEWRCTQGADDWVQLRWFISQIKDLKEANLGDI